MLSSQGRLAQIVNDILMDMVTQPRLMDGRGSAMLICSSIYMRAEASEVVTDFSEFGLIDLIVKNGLSALESMPAAIKVNEEAMAETIENNMRKLMDRFLPHWRKSRDVLKSEPLAYEEWRY